MVPLSEPESTQPPKEDEVEPAQTNPQAVSDNSLSDLLPEICFSIGLELLQNEGRDLLRSVRVVANRLSPIGSHLTLNRQDCASGIGDRLSLRSDSN